MCDTNSRDYLCNPSDVILSGAAALDSSRDDLLRRRAFVQMRIRSSGDTQDDIRRVGALHNQMRESVLRMKSRARCA